MGYKDGEQVRIGKGFDEWHKRRNPNTVGFTLPHDNEIGTVYGNEFRAHDNVVCVYVKFTYDPPRYRDPEVVADPNAPKTWGFTEANVVVPVAFLWLVAVDESKA